MRCVRSARSKIHEERLISGEQSLLTHPRDRAIRHILHEVIALFGRLRRFDDFRALVNRGIPLISLAGNETIEVLEAGARRPAIEGSNRACFPYRHLVALAELRRGIPVEPKNLGERRHRIRTYRAVTRRRSCDFRNPTHRHRVMVAPAQQRGTRRRAKGRRVKARVAQAVLGDSFGRGCLARPSENARRAETNVIYQDNKYVRSVLWRTQRLDRRKL